MPKKDFASQLQEIKKREFSLGLQQGIDFGLIIAEIALNNLFHFGQERLDRFEAEHSRLLMEEVAGKEPELLRAELERRLSQIR